MTKYLTFPIILSVLGLLLLWVIQEYLQDKNVIEAYHYRAQCLIDINKLDSGLGSGFCDDISDFKVNFRGKGV